MRQIKSHAVICLLFALSVASGLRAEFTNISVELLAPDQARVTFDAGGTFPDAMVDFGPGPGFGLTATARQFLAGQDLYRAILRTAGLKQVYFRCKAGDQASDANIFDNQMILPSAAPNAWGAVVTWNTPVGGTSVVRFSQASFLDGTARGIHQAYSETDDDAVEHRVVLTGLTPSAQYYYSVLSNANPYTSGKERDIILASGENTFTTPPLQQPGPGDTVAYLTTTDRMNIGDELEIKVRIKDSDGKGLANVPVFLRLKNNTSVSGAFQPASGLTDADGSFTTSFKAEAVLDNRHDRGYAEFEVIAGNTVDARRVSGRLAVREK